MRRRAVPAAAAVAFAAAAANPGASTIGNVELTGFTVYKDPSRRHRHGDREELRQPSGLIAALAKDGIKVQVSYDNNLCSSRRATK